VQPPGVEGDLYSNGALYANMGGEPTYSNVAEVCFNPIAKIKMIKENFRIKKNLFCSLETTTLFWRFQEA
jgi:hypothetical protein